MNLRFWSVLALVGCGTASAPSGDDDDDDVTGPTTPTETVPAPDEDGDGVSADDDCDDADPDVYPGAPERCGDGRITDCSRRSEAGTITLDGEADFEHLADALAAAEPGSELLVCDGAFAGTFDVAVPVTIRSLNGAATTTLSGLDGATISLPGGSALVGLTITGGEATPSGGGVRLTTAGTLTLEACVVSDNRAALGGGLFVPPGGLAVLVDTVVRDNTAEDGGGGVAVGEGGAVELQGTSSITGNHAGWFGGGVYLAGAALTGGRIDGNTVDAELDELFEDYLDFYAESPMPESLPSGTATAGGAGVAVTGTSSLTGVEITGNIGDGGGLSAMGGAVVLTDVSIHDNRAELGAGVLAVDTAVTLTGATEIHANQARRGAGVAAFGAAVGGGVIRDNLATDTAGGVWLSRASLAGATVSGNEGSEGGGVYTEGDCALSDLVVSGNLANEGGGLATRETEGPGDPVVTVTAATFDGNQAGYGGAIYASCDLALVDTWLQDNVATSDGGGLRLYVPIQDGPSAPPLDDVIRVTMTGGGVLRNGADDLGGGVALAVGTLTVDGVDFGVGADDNAPSDVSTDGAAAHGYGAAASFECTVAGCSPAP